MNQTENDSKETVRSGVDTELSTMQRAIKARAITTIENQENQPRLSVRKKLVFATLSILTVIGLIFLINYGVAIMQRIFELWMQDEPPAVTLPQADQPIYVTVEPAQSSVSSAAQASSSAK